MRRANRLPIEQLTPYLLELPDAGSTQLLDLATIFSNTRPVEVEIGFGKGLFLVNEATARPETNFLGIEIIRKYQLFTANRIAKRDLRNVRLACGDGASLLAFWLPPNSLQAVHVYFPDPWWKKRHHKRRLFTASFAGSCLRVLKPGGVLHVATDVEEYFHLVRETVQIWPDFLEIPARPATAGTHDQDYMTNFERKARLKGQLIFRVAYRANKDSGVNVLNAPQTNDVIITGTGSSQTIG